MPEVIQFTVGREYRRSDLHDAYGGSRRGGISPSAKSPIVLLFTGESGKQYGYLHDGFRKNGAFWYTGEGRKGDMRMIKGNLAVRNSATNGKQLHLFEQTRKGFAQYLGEFSYLDHHEDRAPDSDGKLRNVIVSSWSWFLTRLILPQRRPRLRMSRYEANFGIFPLINCAT